MKTPGANQTDCPRFTQTASWIENYNGYAGVPAETVVTNTLSPGQTYTVPGGATQSATLIEVTQAQHPHGAISKTYVGTGGWQEGLPLYTEDWANNAVQVSERKRWTQTVWTQDYPQEEWLANPRVTESKIGDATNIKRSTFHYYLRGITNVSIAGLVSEVKIYDTNQTTVLKKAVNEYNFESRYIDRRIIGLPTLRKLYDGNDTLLSQVGYGYDESDFSDETLGQNIAPVQHDTANYGADFVVGRGNLTSVTRFDVTGATPNVTSETKYNTAGLAVAQIDPMGRTVKIRYEDSFNDNNNSRNTFAYPTKLIDPAGNFSTVKYRFDIGANVRAQSPAPHGNTVGKITTRLFDSLGRLEKEAVLKPLTTGGTPEEYTYTRYEYPTNQVHGKVYATVTDTNNNGKGDAADEVLSESWTDGAGRVIKARTPLTWNSSGATQTWAGSLTEYDELGQVKRASVPTEVDASWNATGDDATRGWLWNRQEYDWKGRVTKSIPTDSTGNDGKEELISYDGCGCAGGQVTTIQSAEVPRDDQPNTLARRTQKVYADILGRTYKTEVLNWNGSVYSSTVTNFNGRDQAIWTKTFSGAPPSDALHSDSCPTSLPNQPQTCQLTTQTFDGHGRLSSIHIPQQDENEVTAFTYFADDQKATATDARGTSANFSYNNRGLLQSVNFSNAANTNFPAAPAVDFDYDAVGNRTWMEDGLGRVDYVYNELSRLQTETRTFDTGLTDVPVLFGTAGFSYTYHLSGGLKSAVYPTGMILNYNHDRGGNATGVTGNYEGESLTFLSTVDYRAWGAAKKIVFGNGNSAEYTFNNSLMPATEKYIGKATGINGIETKTIAEKHYSYYADGKIKLVNDLVTQELTTNYFYHRLHEYDNVGRLKTEKSGKEAIGTAVNGDFIKYRHQYDYDVWGNQTKQDEQFRLTFGGGTPTPGTYKYRNNRNMGYQNSEGIVINAWQYDADGRPLTAYSERSRHESTYNTGGFLTKQKTFELYRDWRSEQDLMNDGDGRPVRSKEQTRSVETDPNGQQTVRLATILRYQIYSSVLGEAVVFQNLFRETEAHTEQHQETTTINKIYGLGKRIATQKKVEVTNLPTYKKMNFEYETTFAADRLESEYSTENTNGVVLRPWKMDVRGMRTEKIEPSPEGGRGLRIEERYDRRNAAFEGDCTLDGVWMPCSMTSRFPESTVPCPQNDCSPRSVAVHDRDGNVIRWDLTLPFRATLEGSGFPLQQQTIDDNMEFYVNRYLTAGGDPMIFARYFAPLQDKKNKKGKVKGTEKTASKNRKKKQLAILSNEDVQLAGFKRAAYLYDVIKQKVTPELKSMIAKYSQSVQSLELTICHAAQESEFVKIQVQGKNGELIEQGIENPATGDLGLFQIQVGTANDAAALFSKVAGFKKNEFGPFTKEQVRDIDSLNTFVATYHFQNLVNKFGGGIQGVRNALGAYKQGYKGYNRDGATNDSKIYVSAVLYCESFLQERGF